MYDLGSMVNTLANRGFALAEKRDGTIPVGQEGGDALFLLRLGGVNVGTDNVGWVFTGLQSMSVQILATTVYKSNAPLIQCEIQVVMYYNQYGM